MADAHKNFATSLVVVAPIPASSGTTLTVTTGEAARFPTVPFNAVVCPAAAVPTPANAEVVRVTGIATDVLTITRAQESSSARTIVLGDRIYAGPTAKTLTDVETDLISETLVDAKGDLVTATAADTPARKAVGTDYQTLRALASDAAGLSWDNAPSVQVTHSANQTITNNTETTLAMNSEEWDTDVQHDNTTNNSRLTCKRAGLYHIWGFILWDTGSTGDRVLKVRLNGTTVKTWDVLDAVNFSSNSASAILNLAVNDYLELRVVHTQGANLICLGGAEYPRFGMTWLRPAP